MNIPFGYLMFQRKIPVLHGSAINLNNKGIIFSGFSKTGKSSLLIELLKKGRMITEDVCKIKFIKNKPFISKSFPFIKTDSLPFNFKGLGLMELENLLPDKRGRKYYYVKEKKMTQKSPLLINTLVILKWGNKIEMEAIDSSRAFKALFPHLFKTPLKNGRPIFKDKEFELSSLSNLSDIISKVKIIEFTRPKFEKNDILIDYLEQNI
ncbi:MAG: hypothetical protein CMG64_07635 [Candidatus Marinimicrobia bacterium]|nr:hypothetical protein [Candidatus Neomarinimicrobiota bacterium]|tara:strand:+ start:1140 stop:1763 length:624 start_codon:yes stop_codon:yes gene_type:complete